MSRGRAVRSAGGSARAWALALGTILALTGPATVCAEKAAAPAVPRLELPRELEPHRDALQRSVKPFVRITGTRGATKLWESKLGGSPYLPRGAKYPRDAKGRPMKLLAQINFAEVPDAGLLPRKGILQFFLSTSDELYGLDFDRPTRQRNYRVIFFADVVQDPAALVQDFGFVPRAPGSFPLAGEARLSFAVESAPVPLTDFHFDMLLPPAARDLLLDSEKAGDAYAHRYSAGGHKMGGYAFFTQEDPRENSHAEYDTLLLQVDSDDALDLMWGDAGVANFFIREKDLRRGSFTDVLYNWDCY